MNKQTLKAIEEVVKEASKLSDDELQDIRKDFEDSYLEIDRLMNGDERNLKLEKWFSDVLENEDSVNEYLNIINEFAETEEQRNKFLNGSWAVEKLRYSIPIKELHTTPEVCTDGWHCSPCCDYVPNDDPNICGLSGDELTWHDYFIADCAAKGNE